MTYDQVNRPLSFTFGPAPAQTTPVAGSSVFTHAYDLTNRRIGQTATDNSWWSYPTTASTVAYTANSLDQYSAIGAITPTYDGNGNLTYDGTFTYGYDAESRLVSVMQGGVTVATYVYDALGRRKSKTVGSATTIYVTDPANRALLDYDGTSGAVQNWYAFGVSPNRTTNGFGIKPNGVPAKLSNSFESSLNNVLSQINVTLGTRTTPIPDVLGSIVGFLNSNAAAITKIGYQTFGESSTTGGTFGYTGARIDGETNGLYDFRTRMYSPTLGRFLQADAIGYKGGSNLYAYVNNDPINLTDPNGRCPSCLIGGLLNVGIGYGISTLLGQEYTLGNAAIDFGIGFVTGGVATLSAAARGAQIVQGVYVVETVAGETYVGQSGNIASRLAQHVDSGFITQEAADSARLFEVLGGKTSREVAEQAVIDSYGGLEDVANAVNPIGGRPWLASDPTLGNIVSNNLINWGTVAATDVGIDTLTQSTPAQGGAFPLPK